MDLKTKLVLLANDLFRVMHNIRPNHTETKKKLHDQVNRLQISGYSKMGRFQIKPRGKLGHDDNKMSES